MGLHRFGIAAGTAFAAVIAAIQAEKQVMGESHEDSSSGQQQPFN
jgi:hypothetical protein